MVTGGTVVVVGAPVVVVGLEVVVVGPAVVVPGPAVVVGPDVVAVVGGADAWAWAGAHIEVMIGLVQLLGSTREVATPPIITFKTCRRS